MVLKRGPDRHPVRLNPISYEKPLLNYLQTQQYSTYKRFNFYSALLFSARAAIRRTTTAATTMHNHGEGYQLLFSCVPTSAPFSCAHKSALRRVVNRNINAVFITGCFLLSRKHYAILQSRGRLCKTFGVLTPGLKDLNLLQLLIFRLLGKVFCCLTILGTAFALVKQILMWNKPD
jgi:hypothetical protein